MGPILGHERAVDHYFLAAGPLEADRVPVVVDRNVGARHEEGAIVRHAAFGRHDSAEEKPVGMIDAAREVPSPAESKSAVDPLDLSLWHVARRYQHRAVFRP